MKYSPKNLISRFNTNDPLIIADALGIIIVYEDLGTINGYYNTSLRQKFIHINSNLPEHLQRYTAAHELGHAVLHPHANTPFLRSSTLYSVNRLEREANKFAVELLVQDEELKNSECTTMEQVAHFFGVRESDIDLKFK